MMEQQNVVLHANEAVIVNSAKRKNYKEQAIERTGEIGISNSGQKMVIDEYNNSDDINVRFLDTGTIVHTSYSNFKLGKVRDPYAPNVYGAGFTGYGIYKVKVDGHITKAYETWSGIMRRSFSVKFKEKYPTYRNVSVCEEFKNFQFFGKWFDENYYEVEGEKMDLDKDILIKGNRVYSPEGCCFIPHSLNTLFITSGAIRGKLPVGVTAIDNKYMARCKVGNNKLHYIGRYNTPEEAFEAYKTFKEEHIKQVVKRYQRQLPAHVFEALMQYQVEITD